MSDSVYRKTALPTKLNLNDRNTRDQLKGGDPNDTGRGALEGVGPSNASSAKDSVKDCNAVMRKDLKDWLKDHGIHGPPPSQEAEQRAMWQWIRDFHKEYNDDWFSRNMPRVVSEFKPLFVAEMKSMKAAVAKAAAPAASAAPAATDLLDFDQPASAPAAAPVVAAANKGSDDLLSLDAEPPIAVTQAAATGGGGYSAEAAPTPAPAQDPMLDVFAPCQPAATTVTPAVAPSGTSNGTGGLLDLVMDVPAPAAAAAVAPVSVAPGHAALSLDDPFASVAPQPVQTAPATANATKDSMDLLDLM